MAKQLYKSINAKPIGVAEYLSSVWRMRNLIWVFAFRDLKVQYAQTYLGLLWSVIQPLTGLVIFSVFFQRLVPLSIQTPYAVFAFTGIMGWFYFTSLVGQCGTVLMHNQQLIKKVHFPRLILPLSKVLVGLTEFVISLSLLFVLLLINGTGLSAKIAVLPLALLYNVIAGLSIGIWLAALTIRFRDLHHLIPFLIGFGIWLTPVFYPATIVPPSYNWLYSFHPVANVISVYRWIFIGMPIDVFQVGFSFVLSLLLFISGLLFFIRNEKFIADYL